MYGKRLPAQLAGAGAMHMRWQQRGPLLPACWLWTYIYGLPVRLLARSQGMAAQ